MHYCVISNKYEHTAMKKEHRDNGMFPAQVGCYLNEREKAFCQLIYVCGYSATQAYRLIISPEVSVSSASSLGCRLLQEPRIQRYIQALDLCQYSFRVNMKALKYR